MFEKERFIEECRAALKDRDTHAVVRGLVARAVSDPARIVRALGEPRAGVDTIDRAHDLTILNLCWGPRMKDTVPLGHPQFTAEISLPHLAANGIPRLSKSGRYDVEEANERFRRKSPSS